jgi:hypothetical protein
VRGLAEFLGEEKGSKGAHQRTRIIDKAVRQHCSWPVGKSKNVVNSQGFWGGGVAEMEVVARALLVYGSVGVGDHRGSKAVVEQAWWQWRKRRGSFVCWLGRWKMKQQNGVEIRKEVAGCSRLRSCARAHGVATAAEQWKQAAAASQ